MDHQHRLSILSRSEIVREGLRRILHEQGFQVHQAVASITELDEADGEDHLIVVDAVEFSDGLACCAEIRARMPNGRTVLMVDEYDMASVAKAFQTGAVDGYLIKDISCKPLAESLRLIALGEKLLPSQLAEALSDPFLPPRPPHWNADEQQELNLSVREVDILRCLIDGDANKVISRRLRIADATVKVHIKAILRKLRVKNRTQAAIWAVSRGVGYPNDELLTYHHPALEGNRPETPSVVRLSS